MKIATATRVWYWALPDTRSKTPNESIVASSLLRSGGAKTETSSRALKAETAAKMTEYLRNNVATMYGDGQFSGLNVCAKSGTAEHEGETADAMFAGFCVDENCPLAFVVFVENGGSGSAVAAPIAAKVLQVCAAALYR